LQKIARRDGRENVGGSVEGLTVRDVIVAGSRYLDSGWSTCQRGELRRADGEVVYPDEARNAYMRRSVEIWFGGYMLEHTRNRFMQI
jgi:hypothetical protein